jgi:hypothetical protein
MREETARKTEAGTEMSDRQRKCKWRRRTRMKRKEVKTD